MRTFALWLVLATAASAAELEAPLVPAIHPAIAAPVLPVSFTPAPAALPSVPAAPSSLFESASLSPSGATAANPAPSPSRMLTIRDFRSAALGNGRAVAVYLPPGYDDSSDKRYPVLYAQDGQNVFDDATAFAGVSWGLRETADALIASGQIEPIIIVAPYNAGEDKERRAEYMPKAVPGVGGGKGELYASFLAGELKPAIDERFRTDPSRSAVIGSSLGGLISMHLAWTRPGLFFGVAAMSAPWELADADQLRFGTLPQPRPRVWLDMGTREGDNPSAWSDYVGELHAVRDTLVNRDWTEGSDLQARVYEGAAHHESAWRARAADVLRFLFPARR